jgi:hypothetical protein
MTETQEVITNKLQYAVMIKWGDEVESLEIEYWAHRGADRWQLIETRQVNEIVLRSIGLYTHDYKWKQMISREVAEAIIDLK